MVVVNRDGGVGDLDGDSGECICEESLIVRDECERFLTSEQ